jgi:hypothetical protein
MSTNGNSTEQEMLEWKTPEEVLDPGSGIRQGSQVEMNPKLRLKRITRPKSEWQRSVLY